MAQLAIAAAGAVVGNSLGIGISALGMSGAAVGWTIGSILGAAFTPGQKSAGPRLDDLKVVGTDYGQTIPWVAGSPRIAGQIVWSSDRRETATTEEVGKGGGGSEYTSYSYDVDLLILLTENPISGVSRIWSNGELVYSDGQTKDGVWVRHSTYTGTEDQLPDPTYEAAVGTANAPAYRGMGSVFIEGLKLGSSGTIPNLTFEVGPSNYVDTSAFSAPLHNGPQDTITPYFTNYSIQNPYSGVTTSYDSTLGFSVTRELNVAFWSTYLSYSVYPNTSKININNSGMYGQYANAVFEFEITRLTADTSNNDYIGQENVILSYDQSQPYGYNHNVLFIAKKVSGTSWNLQIKVGANPNTFYYQSELSDISNYYNKKIKVSRSFSDNTISVIVDGVAVLNWPVNATGTSVGEPYHSINCGFVNAGFSTAQARPLSVSIKNLRVYPETHVGEGGYSPVIGKPLTEVVDTLLTRSELPADAVVIDPSGTNPVKGLAISQVSPTRNILEQLQVAYNFDVTSYDKIYFRPRLNTPVATISFDELGLSQNNPLSIEIKNDMELATEMSLQYFNILSDYQTGSENSDRLTDGYQSTSNIQLPIGMTPSEAKSIINRVLYDQVNKTRTVSITLPIKYCYVEPNDVILVYNDDSTRLYRLRVTEKQDNHSELKLKCVFDSEGVSQIEFQSDDTDSTVTTVQSIENTDFHILDIPALRDVDTDLGYYSVGFGTGAANEVWPGGVLVKSFDDVNFERVNDFSQEAIAGVTSTVLGNWTNNTFDEVNTVTVNVGNGTLSSSTRSNVLNNTSLNACIIGDEILQFVTATLVSAGIYRLSGLLRGRRGTEHYRSTHQTVERFVLLDTSNLRRNTALTNHVGLTHYVKAATFGFSIQDAVSKSFVLNANSIRPFSVANLRIDQNQSESKLTWNRRTKLQCKYVGDQGFIIPLGETYETYRVRVKNGSTLLRTEEVSVPEYEYGVTKRTEDGLGVPTLLTFEVTQLNQEVGEGVSNTLTANI